MASLTARAVKLLVVHTVIKLVRKEEEVLEESVLLVQGTVQVSHHVVNQ